MQLTKICPPRIFSCGIKNSVKIHDIGRIHMNAGETVFINFGSIIAQVDYSFWGYRVNLLSQAAFTVGIWGNSWQKAHALAYEKAYKDTFERYARKERLKCFWKIDLHNRDLKSTDGHESLTLKSDEQLTFQHENLQEYDFAAKDWGAYVTPSFYSRLKSFLFTPMISVPKDHLNGPEIFIVDQRFLAEFESEICEKNKRFLRFSLESPPSNVSHTF